jgi:predicted  nucleic acid-binding Zn ribbon protein
MNGQINGREWPIYFGSGLCSAIVLSPEEDSLNLRIPRMADSDSTLIADSVPRDGGHPLQVP